ncbi:MAG: hypothetical protein ACI4PI_00545 [Oscillospiraceae bacterium]
MEHLFELNEYCEDMGNCTDCHGGCKGMCAKGCGGACIKKEPEV